MARTPLFRVARRAFRLARAANAASRPAGEILDRYRAAARPAWNRREVLGAGAALGAAAALGCRTLAPGRKVDHPVVVVGAGIAGLTCAYRLVQAGVPTTLYEAQPRTGGRMFSLRGRFADDQVVELGGELIDTPHEKIRALAAELGIELDDLADEAPGIRAETWWFGGRRRSDEEVVEAFRPVAARVDAALAHLEDDAEITYRTPQGLEALDRQTIAEWLDDGEMEGWFRELLDVAYTTEYGLEIGEQSALNFLWMIDPNPDPFRIFGESDERFHVRGGNDRVPGALAERLAAHIETGHVLEAVSARSGGGYAATFRKGAASLEVAADQLVLALPFTLLREVELDVELPEVKRRAIAELGYGTNAKLMIGFDSRPWRSTHRANGSVLAELPFQLCWETSRKQAGAAGVLTNFTGGRHGLEIGSGTAAEQAAAVVADLERVFPGVAAARAGMTEARFHWPSNPWVKGSYACYLPGQWTTICGAEGESVGDLHFCGEHCSLAAQGYMEGGCETGEAAAEAVLARLGRASARTA